MTLASCSEHFGKLVDESSDLPLYRMEKISAPLSSLVCKTLALCFAICASSAAETKHSGSSRVLHLPRYETVSTFGFPNEAQMCMYAGPMPSRRGCSQRVCSEKIMFTHEWERLPSAEPIVRGY